jgi:hypothetical protein
MPFVLFFIYQVLLEKSIKITWLIWPMLRPMLRPGKTNWTGKLSTIDLPNKLELQKKVKIITRKRSQTS